jgi:hypothetical protein
VTANYLPALMGRVREISEADANHQRAWLWAPESTEATDHGRGPPRRYSEVHAAPFTVEPEFPLWAKIIGFDMEQFYTDPECYLENTLRIAIYRHEHFKECTPAGKTIGIWLGATLESSLFGARTIYFSDASPWLDHEAVIRDEKDLAAMPMPDFYHSGLMPLAHHFYERIGELLDDDFSVTFPEWGRSPFGVAFHMRLLENLAVDMIDNPGFVHRLMRFITDARKQWWQERSRFLGIPLEPANLYNDEVNCPTLSPAMFEEFVLPYEQELSEFHGGIGYWHSCGNTTKLVSFIDRIPNLNMFHVGPWTDLRHVVKVFGGRHPLEICLNPVVDVQMANEDTMRAKMAYIMETCGSIAYTVRADGLQDLHGVPRELAQINQWLGIAHDMLLDGAHQPGTATI